MVRVELIVMIVEFILMVMKVVGVENELTLVWNKMGEAIEVIIVKL